MAKLVKYIATIAVVFLFGSEVQSANGLTKCSCDNHYLAYRDTEYPRDCHEAVYQCPSNNDRYGIYLIRPDQYPEPFPVVCENSFSSSGWTVIQRRYGASVSFNRTWTEYKDGFGFLGSEFWIGNEILAHLTNQNRHQLRIDVENTKGESYFLLYDNFRISDEWDNYSLLSLSFNRSVSDIPIDWCVLNTYNQNDSICERTCENPNECIPLNTSEVERCTCDGTYMVHEDGCIPKEQCGCYDQDNDIVIAEGDSSVKFTCSLKITCRNNRLVTESYNCSKDATCEEQNGVGICRCNQWFEGNGLTCARSGPLDCFDLYRAGKTSDMLYTIYPHGSSGFEVFCQMSNGGWTILQKRTNESLNFYRDWDDYKNGFGNLRGDHWLGNEKIHTLTSQRSYELYIEMTNGLGSSHLTRYMRFSISNERQKYQLSLGDYNGNAGNNAMGANSGYRFSTYDEDDDGSTSFNCAEEHRGGWWYPEDSTTGSTEQCYTFSNRDIANNEYSDCNCYSNSNNIDLYVDGCYKCGNITCHFKCFDCDGCPGDSNNRLCYEKIPIYETNFYSCGHSNLNGDYLYSDYRGIFWKNVHGTDCGITATTMKIRFTK